MSKPRRPQIDPSRLPHMERLVDEVRAEVKKRCGPDSTYEERRDASAVVMGETLWLDEEKELQELAETEEEVEVEGAKYRRLEQSSSATYRGRFGSHEIAEPLYRRVGVHNGPTIKPLDVRVGVMPGRMTPDFARIAGELSGSCNSRELEKILTTVGLRPPSRAFLEKRLVELADTIGSQIECLEGDSREQTAIPGKVASISCGTDRMAIRMTELADDEEARPVHRRKPYQRQKPLPTKNVYRMSWVGSTTLYDSAGEVLQSFRYAAPANADADEIARRVSADVVWVMASHPDVPLQCVQDGAPELRKLPKLLKETLPPGTQLNELIDFEHLMGYLDAIVDVCDPGDSEDMKGRYRSALLTDDEAIDRIFSDIKRQRNQLEEQPQEISKQREAMNAAITYIRCRKDRMRYATFYEQGLTIGSGDTEGTVGLMQQRVKRRGQSWKEKGLRGIQNVRALVLSNRWKSAWNSFAAQFRKEVVVTACG